MKKVTCPNCNNYGSLPTMEESMLVFDLEEEGDLEGAKNRCFQTTWSNRR